MPRANVLVALPAPALSAGGGGPCQAGRQDPSTWSHTATTAANNGFANYGPAVQRLDQQKLTLEAQKRRWPKLNRPVVPRRAFSPQHAASTFDNTWSPDTFSAKDLTQHNNKKKPPKSQQNKNKTKHHRRRKEREEGRDPRPERRRNSQGSRVMRRPVRGELRSALPSRFCAERPHVLCQVSDDAHIPQTFGCQLGTRWGRAAYCPAAARRQRDGRPDVARGIRTRPPVKLARWT